MRITIHPTHPQKHLVKQAVEVLRADGVIVYPTDSCYALGCAIDSVAAVQRIRQIRQMTKHQYLSLVCRDLSELSTFARVDNASYRMLRSLVPGPYTFILETTRELPRRLQDKKRKTVGLRVPDHPITAALLDGLGTPMLSATAQDSAEVGMSTPLHEPEEIQEILGRRIDAFLDCGPGGLEPTTVVDLSRGGVQLVRQGGGSIAHLIED